MNVTRAMIDDLLPLYASGEASADTRAAVESFLREDEALRRQLAALQSEDPGAIVPVHTMGPDTERRTLARTQVLIRRRTWQLAVAILLTALPFSFVFGDNGLRFFFLRDAPVAAGACFAGAAAFWALLAMTVRRLRVTGL